MQNNTDVFRMRDVFLTRQLVLSLESAGLLHTGVAWILEEGVPTSLEVPADRTLTEYMRNLVLVDATGIKIPRSVARFMCRRMPPFPRKRRRLI